MAGASLPSGVNAAELGASWLTSAGSVSRKCAASSARELTPNLA